MSARAKEAVARLLLWITNHVVSRVPLHSVRMAWYRRVMGFDIAPGALVQTDVRFSRRGNLEIGAWSVVNNGVRLDNRDRIVVGQSVSISYGCHVYTKGHLIDDPEFGTSSAVVVIGDHVWLCAQAIVLPGVTIADAAVVLTGSVVSRDVERSSVVAGSPARHVRFRQEGMAYRLTERQTRVPFFG